LVNSGLAYRSPDDYQPIVHLGELPAVLAVRADAPWNTFDEFMADVRKNPGKIRVSNSGFGTTDDLVIRQLNMAANVKMTPVSFTGGGGEAMVALLGGRVEASSRRAITTVPFTQAGKVKVLGSFSKGKYYMYPEATPIGDTYKATLPAMYCVIAPNGMPKEIYDKLVNASLLAVKTPEFKAFAKANGYIGDAKGPEETKAELVNYTSVFAQLIKEMEKK
jgi:tripartite-type tricarboxylate transporter receptor subunit TctC